MITRAHISNFRSIKDVDLSFGLLNVLIGANGAGKSTLLEALNFTKRIASGVAISDAARTYAPFGRDFFNYYSDGYIANFSFDIQTRSDSKYQFNFSIGYNPDFASHEDFYVYSEKLSRYTDDEVAVIFDRTPASKNISFDAGDGANQLPIEIENNRLFIATLSHPDVKEVVDTVSSYEILWADEKYDNPRQSRVVVDDPLSRETVDDVAVALSLKDSDRYQEAVTTIKKVITEFEEPTIVDLANTTTEDTASDEHKSKKKKEYRYIVNWRDSRHADSYYSRFAISGGNLRVIYLILSLYNTESRSCFVAEEIENGMHPGRVKKLVQVLIAIAKKRELQLVFSTHNYILTREVLPRDIIFCKYIDGEGARYIRLTDTDEYGQIKDALNTEPSTEDVLSSGLLTFND
jgi:predicted ATPase